MLAHKAIQRQEDIVLPLVALLLYADVVTLKCMVYKSGFYTVPLHPTLDKFRVTL